MSSNFFNSLKNKFNINLNEQQRIATLHRDGPAIILAVPGAGKTTVLISRTANLILNHNINPENILSITFSKASAKDMKERFNKVFGKALGSKVKFSTIHSFAYFLIREYAYKNRIKYTLIEGNDYRFNKTKILKDIHMKVNGTYINDDKLEDLLNTMGYIKNMMIDIKDFSKGYNSVIKNFEKIYIAYEEFKKANNLIDFDDMLTLGLYILKKDPNILNKYRNQYKYIQVDEGQDTSKVQNEIVRILAYPNNNIFVVADDDQSIYGFRGAFPQYLLDFDKVYSGAKRFFMEENYRSVNNIVSVCNEFIKSNTVRYDKNLFTKNNNKRPVTIVKVKDEDTQYDYIIKKLSSTSNLRDIAILYRNNISSISLVEKLNRNNIPFYMRDTKLNFFNHWVTSDIISFLKLAFDNHDHTSFEKIYYKMKGYISKAAMTYSKDKNSSLSVFDKLLKFPEFRSFQKDNIIKLKKDFRVLSKQNPYRAINFIEHQLEYGSFLKDRCKSFGYSYESILNILSNLKIIAKETNTILEFITRLDELENIIKSSKENKYENALTLSTIHSSKGLEFKEVYLVDLVEGEFPTKNSIESHELGQIKDMEEERRLFYVGMTRSKEVLDILSIGEKNGERVYPSRFIKELESIIGKENKHNFKKEHKLKIGKDIEHINFGKGKIRYIDDDKITIDFGKKGVKELSLDICFEKNLLVVI